MANLCSLLADAEVRCNPYSQPLNSTFIDTDLLLFALQIASAMDHLIQRNVRHCWEDLGGGGSGVHMWYTMWTWGRLCIGVPDVLVFAWKALV